MVDPENERPIQASSGIMLLAGSATAGFGLMALLGWALNQPRLASLGERLIPMAPSSAVLFLLFGIAIGLRAQPAPGPRTIRLTVAMGGMIALLALVMLVLSLRNTQWEGEHLGFSISGTLDGMPIGHMSPASAICFLLASLSFSISLAPSTRRRWRIGVALGAVAAVLGICFVFLLGYAFGVPLLVGGSLIPPALSTILACTTLGVAVMIFASRQISWRAGDPAAPPFLIVVYLLLGTGIVAAGYIYYRSYEQHFLREAEGGLTVIAELKADELARWRAEREGDGSLFFENPAFSARVRRLFDTPTDESARGQLQIWIGKARTSFNYDQFRLLDPQGVTRLSAPKALAPPSAAITEAAAAVLRTGKPMLRDFYRHDHDGRVYLAVVVPIADDRDASRPPLGVLVLRVDPSTLLYPMIQRWPAPSNSAEITLVRREGNQAMVLNTLRFRPDAALALSVPIERTDVPGVRAVLGESGFMEGTDYRGVPVFAVAHAVPDSPWHLVVKMDRAEASAPLRERMWGTILLVGVLLFGTGTGLGLVWRQQRTRFLRERLESAEALRESESRFRVILETMSLLGVVLDPSGRIMLGNDFLLRLTGWKRAEVMGRNWFELFLPPEIRDGIERQIFLKSIATGDIPLHFENEIVTRTGERRLVAWNNTVLRDSRGVVVGVASIGEDITERRRAEAALQASEDRFRRLTQNAPDLIYRYELKPQRGFTYVSPAALAITGFTPEEHYADPALGFKLVHPDDRPLLAAVATGELVPGRPLTLRWVRKDGRVIWTEQRNVPILDAAGDLVALEGIARDITARKEAEVALRESEAFNVAVLDSIDDHVAVLDERAVILAVNRAWRRFAEENGAPELGAGSVGLNYLQVCAEAPKYPSGAEAVSVQAGIAAVLSGDQDGFQLEYPCHGPGESRWFLLTVTRLVGSRPGVVVAHKNVTTRKLAENALRKLVREKDALLREVHHRVKNNLQVITSLLRLEAGRSEHAATRSVLDEMKGRIRSMALLHETLYRTDTFGEVDLASYLKQLSTQLFRSLNARTGAIQLHLNLASVHAEIDRAIPCGLIANELITNCLKHGFPEARTGEVRVELTVLDGAQRVCLRVADTGVGLPAGFTVKQSKSLGLQLVSDLVRQLDGELEIGPGPSADFAVTFTPTAGAAAVQARSRPSQNPFPAP